MKERLISAFIALLLIIPFLLLGGIYFKALVVILGIIGLKEMLNLKKEIPIFPKIISYIFFIILLIFGYSFIGNTLILNSSLFLNIVIILLVSLLTFDKNYNIEDVFYIIASILFLSASFYLFIALRDISLNLFIYIILITTITDTFALLGGKKFGKTKLSPKISPNKTIEGSVCGLIVGSVIASLFYIIFISSSAFIITIIKTILLSIIGQVGDLVFSSIKRHYKIKDFSNIMPGHGGILDRLDSIIFVVIAYLIIFSVI